jgi:Transposase
MVEETLLPEASVSRVARRHDVNANQVFYWRKLLGPHVCCGCRQQKCADCQEGRRLRTNGAGQGHESSLFLHRDA